MKHISRYAFDGMYDNGVFVMLDTMHKTLCGAIVPQSQIDKENCDCEECLDWQIWSEIDRLAENEVTP